ncbi:interleukin-23 receptor isoform X2 [Haemorhous mexicanus]|nr:interleukin-23 receptor isoform X2 [Haemorhous mexicanus]XP_059709537.1 interleukin-23 receptor isoform X2 [Haemorhous mexicanus]XP_059709538.1 interleukin-23 receptor isoform X2 [Haemorhous mexicanus]XP_059709539.1 interleukin-23 receptor isoform X2 [Haemorhous mexicanus]XP_059709540.1 interleukin-23 receptor isoform X2 [Haemorhous mexicanus]
MAGAGQALVLPVLLCCLCPGAANFECKGRVWIEPAPVVRLGSDISIGCQSWLGCPSPQLLILLNYSRAEGTPLALPGGAVRLRLRRFQMPFATVTCFSRCAQRDRLVCGTELRAGYPPDPPGNLSCAIAEGSERLECGWEPGRLTHLPTRHSLHLRRVVAQDEEDEDDEEEKTFPADSPVLLRELHNGSQYSVWVQASNALGTARSAPQHLSLQELVVPALPVAIGAETTDTSPASTTTRWRSRTRLRDVHCQERHRATGTPTWHVELCDKVTQEGPRWQHELQSDTEFVFQARCRLGTAHSPWSAWSPPFLYRTPEAAPAAAPAVWRRLGRALPNGSHEVTVLIKPLAARDARGRILGYAVSAESAAGARPLCLTSGTECTVLVPPGARSLLVTARNSKGASSPASIPLTRAAAQEEFPAPEAVEVQPEQQSRVLVQWQRPQPSQSPLLWFILEWLSSPQHGQQEQYGWERIPHHQTHTYIPGAAAPPRVWLYAVYPGGISAPRSSPAPAEEPLLGSTYSQMSQDDDIPVLLGLSLSLVGLSILFAVVMFKKSVRKRVKATLVSLLPAWMSEDFPHMENSTVVKSLQDKADFPSAILQEPFLADPAVTDVQEVPAQERPQSPGTAARAGVAEPREVPRSLVAPRTAVPGLLGAYKPQLSGGNTLGYVAAGICPAQPPAASPQPEPGIFSQDYSSPVPQLWGLHGGTPQLCLLDKINLVLNSSLEFPGQAGHGSVPEQRWEPPGDGPEQMLVPEELLSCLRATNREPASRRAWQGCSDSSWDWG